MRVDFRTLLLQSSVFQHALTQMFVCSRKDVEPEEKIEFKTRLGESSLPLPFGLP